VDAFGPRIVAWWRAFLRGPVLVVAVQAFALAFVAWPWIRPDLQWNDVADAPNHLVRLFALSQAFARGEVYPRWLSDLYLGYGYPLLNFYAPSFYYLGAGLHRLGMTIYASMQWAGVLGAAAGVVGTYALALATAGDGRRPSGRPRGGAGRRDAALVAAVVFCLSPYPFLTNLYVRAAIPEVLGLGLLPWLLLAAWWSWRGRAGWTVALAALTAALMLTHNISALLGLGLLAAWLAVQPLLGAPWRRGPVLRTLGAVVLGVALAAFFWLPALAESRFVQLNLAQGGLYDPLNWLYDPLRGGPRVARKDYHHTRAGPADLSLIFDYNAVGGFAPEKISLGQLVLWGVTLLGVLGLWLWRLRAGRRDVAGPAGAGAPAGSGDAAARADPLVLAAVWVVLALVCWFFNTTWSAQVWQVAPLLPLVQFPWRFYGPFALCLGLGAGAVLAATPVSGWRAWSARGLALALVLLLSYGAVATRPFKLGPEPAHDVDERNLAGLEYNRYGAGTTSGGEFLPRTAQWGEDGNRRGIKVYEDTYPQASWQAGLVRVLDGEGAATAVYQGPGWIGARIEAASPLHLAFHQLLFPGWRGYLDGRPVPLDTTPSIGAIGGSLGIMTVQVPAGSHQVEVRFGPTPPRALGVALSAGTLALVALWLVRYLLAPSGMPDLFATLARSGPAGTRSARGRQTGWPASGAALTLALVVLAAGASVAYGRWDSRARLGPAGAPGTETDAARATRLPFGIGGPSVPADSVRVAADIAGAVSLGRAETAAPDRTGTGALDPYLAVRSLVNAGEERRWLYMHPPASAAIRLRVPARAYFQAGLALDPKVWAPTVSYGDGARFIVEAEGPGGRQLLFERHVNPRARVEDREWIDVWVDLDHLAGQDVRIVLRTDAVDDPNFNWAGWANPQIVVWSGAREQPGSRHQW
jgi:hypothetical protein